MISRKATHNTTSPLPPLPKSWSELTWQQLCDCWAVKLHYGGNPDVARAAACLTLCGLSNKPYETHDSLTGETIYLLSSADGRLWTVTPRQLAHIAKKALPWFDYPYGDPGEKEQKDEKGKVTKERREAVAGYVSPMRDAMVMPVETLRVTPNTRITRMLGRGKTFALPQVAMNNLTWQQYRSLQALVPQLWQDGNTDAEVVHLQAQFLAHCLVPRSFAILDTNGGSIRLRPHWEYKYNAEQADGLVRWWERRLTKSNQKATSTLVFFYVCFQAYQTAVQYYEKVYPLLFQDSGKNDPLRDALTGEVGTINTVMKYAGYAEQQQVYDSNLPFVLDILNTMTKEAKEIEKMNSKIKKK